MPVFSFNLLTLVYFGPKLFSCFSTVSERLTCNTDRVDTQQTDSVVCHGSFELHAKQDCVGGNFEELRRASQYSKWTITGDRLKITGLQRDWDLTVTIQYGWFYVQQICHTFLGSETCATRVSHAFSWRWLLHVRLTRVYVISIKLFTHFLLACKIKCRRNIVLTYNMVLKIYVTNIVLLHFVLLLLFFRILS